MRYKKLGYVKKKTMHHWLNIFLPHDKKLLCVPLPEVPIKKCTIIIFYWRLEMCNVHTL